MRLFCNCGKSMAIKNNLEELIVYLLFGSVRVLATLQSVSRILEDIYVFMTLGGGKCILSKKMERLSQKLLYMFEKTAPFYAIDSQTLGYQVCCATGKFFTNHMFSALITLCSAVLKAYRTAGLPRTQLGGE